MKVEELTFFRFVAAAVVVTYHFGGNNTIFAGISIPGPEMVTFFFVLSGFVMGLAYLHKEFSNVSYWWARVARIVPIYLLGLLLVLLGFHIHNVSFDYTALILNATFLQAWISPYPVSINGPNWSLSVEAFFYLLFPYMILIIRKYQLSTSNAMLIALCCWFLTQVILSNAIMLGLYSGFPSFSHDLIYYFPLSHLCSFILGIAGAMWIVKSNYAIPNPIMAFLVFSLALALVGVVLSNRTNISNFCGVPFVYASSFLSPLFMVFILAVAGCRSGITRILSARPLVLLGEASYSFYILQVPAYGLFKDHISTHVSTVLGLNPTIDFAAFFIFLTVVSICCFLILERPANNFLRTWCL